MSETVYGDAYGDRVDLSAPETDEPTPTGDPIPSERPEDRPRVGEHDAEDAIARADLDPEEAATAVYDPVEDYPERPFEDAKLPE